MDFVDNYDNTLKEPTLLPASFPSVLVNANTGIAVGMASSICPFNLAEVCQTTIALMRDPEHDIASTLLAPDFPGGGQIRLRRGRRSRRFTGPDAAASGCARGIATISPPTASTLRRFRPQPRWRRLSKRWWIWSSRASSRRSPTSATKRAWTGLKITIDLKRGVDPDKLMQRCFSLTPLEDTFSCNFNVLIAGVPRVLGVRRAVGGMGGLPHRMRAPPHAF